MFGENILKQKLKYIFKNKRNKKSSSLSNQSKSSQLFKTNIKDSIYSNKNKSNNSLIIQKLSRNNNKNSFNNNNNHLSNLTSLVIKTSRISKSFLHSSESKNDKPNLNINLHIKKLLQSKLKPYKYSHRNPNSAINKTFNKTININNIKHIKKSELIVKKYFDEREKKYSWKNPFKDYKEPVFIYEIIKFDKYLNPEKNVKEKTKTNYYMLNNKERSEKKYNKNKSNSLFYLHNKKINSLIDKYEKDIIGKNFKEIKKEEKRKLYLIELRDKVEVPSIKVQKIKKMIYKFLNKETDIKQIMENEDFYKKLENRINFIYDGLKIPNIKNRLMSNKDKWHNELVNINAINTKLLIYLNHLKCVVQRKKDESKKKKKFLTKKTLIIDDKNDMHLQYENNEGPLQKLDKEYLYNCQKYFSCKSLSYRNVNISNNILIRNTIFQKYKFSVENKMTEII